MALDLEKRKSYLGSTDLVAISGLSEYQKPGDVWLEKMGRTIFEGNEITQMGQDLEPVVAMRHARRFGVEVIELPGEPIYHPKYPFIAANMDRIYTGKKRVLECKTASEDQLYSKKELKWGEDGEVNRVPSYYLGQVVNYIGISEFDDGVLSCLFLGKSRIQRDYPIEFDPELYDLMIGNGVTFWETYIVPKVQPPIELFSPDVVMKAIALKVKDNPNVLEATQEFDEWAYQYRELSQKIERLSEDKKIKAARIAEWITTNGGTKVKHSLGSFTYQKPKAKAPEIVFDAEAAWHAFLADIHGYGEHSSVPDSLVADLLNLAGEIQERCTTTKVSESSEPKLHPWWAK
jgi:putative phage-type endonuclease